jgi:hypothetical protein
MAKQIQCGYATVAQHDRDFCLSHTSMTATKYKREKNSWVDSEVGG